MKTSIVLSGGGMRAWQAGVLDTVLPRVYATHAYGISMGALNAVLSALWAADAGPLPGEYWERNVRHPQDLFEKKSRLWRLIPGLLRGRFDGLMGFGGLRRKLDAVDWNAVAYSPMGIETGATNMASGQIEYASPFFYRFPDYVLASCAIPMIFPLVRVGQAYYTDGGSVESAPLRRAIQAGAERIICVFSAPRFPAATHFRPGNAVALASRHMEIIAGALMTRDIERAESINRDLVDFRHCLKPPSLLGKRVLEIIPIVPENDLPVSVDDFEHDDIRAMVDLGRRAGAEVDLGPCAVSPVGPLELPDAMAEQGGRVI